MKLSTVWGRLLMITVGAATFAGACSAVTPRWIKADSP